MTRLAQLSDSLERARSQLDAANAKLAQIQRDVRENKHELRVARHNVKTGQRIIAQRVVSLYTTDRPSTLEVVLGARSLDDMLTRLDNAKSVTSLDTRVLSEVRQFRASAKLAQTRLAHAKVEQQKAVAARAAAKHTIESQISEQQRLLGSIKDEIVKLQAAERARQLQMLRAAQARLVQQHHIADQQAQETVVGISAVTPSAETVIAPPPTHGGVVGVALSELGTPYVWGGAAPGGFDCSGLVMWAYAQVGVALPHSTYAQWGYGVPVSSDQLAPGDLVFFDGLGHVGIYIGGGEFVHAPHTGDVVKISSLGDPWYAAMYVGARRIL
jgi:peptidoglycan DL-endopeptidase CwlO